MMQFGLKALQEPGPLETRIANQAKHFTIRRASMNLGAQSGLRITVDLWTETHAAD
jgi:hypothetical protein